MLIGAFSAAAGAIWTGNAFLGLLVGVGAAMIGGIIHAVWCITLRGDQIVAGTAINLLGLGIPTFLTQRIWGMAGGTPSAERLPALGPLNILVYLAFILVPIVHFTLFELSQDYASWLRVSTHAQQRASALMSAGIGTPV